MTKPTGAAAARPLRYHLRFQIAPGPRVRQDARDLVAFCKAHGVEEVVLFVAAEEWNNGLLSEREESLWFETVRDAKRILDRAGIVTSLNPWMTVLHCDRGRHFPDGRQFKPQVSPLGEVSRACASFADPAWRKYVYDLYGRFATLGFRVLWVEDDFRYHNHEPLTWGGGFEPEILERFGSKVGRAVGREEVVAAIVKPAEPHPWRRLWQETWREIKLEVAAGLAQSVAVNSGDCRSRLGLMSSHPAVHSVEGRDWEKLFESLSIEGRVAHRPHYAGYGEAPGRSKTYSMMMLDLQKQFRPAEAEVAPEVENFPFTNWNKSDSLTWAEMALCEFHGADALLLDLFPFAANSAKAEPAIGKLLDDSRPGLSWIAARFGKTLATTGVGLPWKQDAAAYVQTLAGKSLHELEASPFGPGELLLPNGIPVCFTRQAVNAVFGNDAWIFDDAEWRELLAGGLLLDADSALILQQRGLGDFLGARVEAIVDREGDSFARGVIAASRAGVPAGFRFNCNLMGRMAQLTPAKGAAAWTQVLRADGSAFGAGLTVYRNQLGGRVAVFAAPNPAALPANYQWQALVHELVNVVAGGRFASARVLGSPHCLPMHFVGSGGEMVVVLNGSPDPARPTVFLPGRSKKPKGTLLAPLAKPQSLGLSCKPSKGGLAVTFAKPIPYLGFAVLQ